MALLGGAALLEEVYHYERGQCMCYGYTILKFGFGGGVGYLCLLMVSLGLG